MQGAAPAFIQWNTPAHPAVAMPDLGCSLAALEIHHPQAAAIQEMLDHIGFEGKLSPHALPVGATPYLLAHIQTPDGPRKLDCNMS